MPVFYSKQKSWKMSTADVILLFTATVSGLIAGLLYSYACSVTLGLGKLPDKEYLGAMQSINKEIVNPVFLLSFLGTIIVLPIITFINYTIPVSGRFQYLLFATVIYAIGVLGITFFGNIPLNNSLATFNVDSSSISELARFRLHFELPWNKLHLIRTIASVLSFILVILACLNRPG